VVGLRVGKGRRAGRGGEEVCIRRSGGVYDVVIFGVEGEVEGEHYGEIVGC
jgi:hypothetical protein